MSNYLHDAVPVVAGGNAEECQERHAKVAEVSVLVEPDARVFQRTFYARRRDIYLFNITDKRTRRSLTCHTAKTQCLTQKEPVKYTNKLIKKTTDTKLQRILAVNKKSNTG